MLTQMFHGMRDNDIRVSVLSINTARELIILDKLAPVIYEVWSMFLARALVIHLSLSPSLFVLYGCIVFPPDSWHWMAEYYSPSYWALDDSIVFTQLLGTG